MNDLLSISNTKPTNALFDLSDLLNQFQSGSLENLEDMKLLNRRDRKYIFPNSILPNILEELTDNYYILQIDNNREFSYSNVYYDTDDFLFYKWHHNGKMNRYKVRYRHYIESDSHFVEIKHKSNKKKTFKERFEKAGFEERINGNAEKAIKKAIGIETKQLKANVMINYSRITLFHKHQNEKVTIDRNLSFETNGKLQHIANLVIAEVKRNGKLNANGFVEVAKKFAIRPISISKYCISLAFGIDNIKYNRFKPKLLKIKGLNDGISIGNREF